uniref:Rap guanine nucleotide exchange factor 1 n=1 Tax=Schistocephalus solidus TaxID=70667 RepID=A0A0X3PJZ8_SCHSO
MLNYMYRFGRSDLHDPLLDSRISRKVADFFQAKWRKRETAQGPHDRSKTVAYVQKYSQPTGAGTVIQRSTCVQQTCHVRMVGGLQELMQQISSSVPVSIVCTPAPPAPKTSENATSCQLIGKEKPDIDREEKCMQTGDNFANGIFSSGVADNAASNKSAHPMKIDLPRTHTVQHLYSCSSVTAGDHSNSLTVGPVSAPGSTSCSKNGSPSTFRRRHPRPSRRKASLEDPPTNSNSPSDTSHSFPLYDVEVCSVSLPTVEEAERLHPLLAELDATPFLDIENTESDTDLDIQAGTIDALVVYATSIGRAQRSFLLALDVFLFMYRTFMTSEDLINRLIQRYLLFQSSARLQESVEDKTRLKICNFVVSYLIRVVSRLSQDLTPEIYALLQAFRERVLKDGHTALGKALESTLAGALKRMPTKAPLLQPQPTQVPSALPGIESPFYNHDLLHSEPCAVRRSHSIGVVAERSEPASDLETKCLTLQPRDPGGGDSGVSDTTATLREQRPRVGGLWASARNSFSDTNMGVAVSPNQLLQRSSSPSCSTFSDLELDCSQISTPPMGGSCVSSPVMSKRPTPQTGVSREERGSQSVVMSPVATITLTRSPCSSVSIQRRRRLSLLDVPAKLLAEQLTYLEAEKYKHLTLNELLDIRSLVETKAPGVAACAAQFSALSNWAATLLLEPPESQRERCALKLLNTMDHLRALKNFNSFLAILCAFLLIPEDIFSKKTRARLARLRPYMQPPHFSTYRRELAESSPPLIPYLGLTLQNLIVLDQVNAVFLSKVPKAMAAAYKEAHGPIVNFWRCWKHFLIIDFFVKQESSDTRAAHYDIKKDRDVLDFIGDFRTAYPDFALRELINRRKRQAT